MKRIKKIICIVIVIVILMGGAIIYLYSTKIDTILAIEYGEVFGSFDIGKVDQYLSEDTLITYNGVTKTYKEVRNNVIAAFEERICRVCSTYGHGDDIFRLGVQSVGIYVGVDPPIYQSHYVSIDIQQNWFIFYKIKSITSTDDFFGYLFFGIKK